MAQIWQLSLTGITKLITGWYYYIRDDKRRIIMATIL